jgi:nucleoside-triphosphatase THEP1
MRDALIGNVTNREDTEVFTVTKENRDRLAEVINDKALDFLRAFRVDGF